MVRTKSEAKKVARRQSLTKSVKKKPVVAQMGSKKPHRFRPGTRAEMDIRWLQSAKSPDLLTQKAPMVRLIREIAAEIHPDLRMTPHALLALRTVYEAEANKLFQSANRMAQHASRVTVMPKDFHAVVDIRDIYPDEGHSQHCHSLSYLKDKKAAIEKTLAKNAHRRNAATKKKEETVQKEAEESEDPAIPSQEY